MKKFPILIIFIALTIPVQAQYYPFVKYPVAQREKFYQKGVTYFKEGNYIMADSAFTDYLKHYSKDENALFSLAVTQLYLKDTLHFCKNMLDLYNSFQDKEAGKYYFNYCGTADTVFLNRKHQLCNPEHAKYMVITETHKYYKYKTVVIHNKKINASIVTVGSGLSGILKNTDVVAEYRLYPDGHKLYTSLLINVSGILKNESIESDYLENNPIIKQVKTALGLKKEIAHVQFILGKNGNIHDIKITHLSVPLSPEKRKELDKYVRVITSSIPLKPVHFSHQNVNFLDSITIEF